ncbi:glycoside hydrolase family 2 protein [Pedobacter sp.]|uniref:glycoside hydrolase family 2 protein n=1 Tax=Pedobacter sp. TaxID=1411316 RepID=UPI003C36F07B
MKLKPKLTFLALLICFSSQAQILFVKERNHINLTDWVFTKGVHYNAQKETYNTSSWEKVKVPHTYSMEAINGSGYYRGEAWYRTQVSLPKSMEGERIFIRFEAVGHQVQVFLNNQLIGNHLGGYSAFCFEITDLIDPNSKNTIALKTSNAPNFKIIPLSDNLFNLYGGIYRPVQIFSTPKTAISPTYYASSGVFVELKELKNNTANLEFRTHISNTASSKDIMLEYNIFDAKNNLVEKERKAVSFVKKDTIIHFSVKIKNPILWNGKENPHQYRAEVSIENENKVDKVNQKFGIKTYAVTPNIGFELNNNPYRLYGVAMHQDWKQTGPALSDEQHQRDMALVDEIGATALRLSHYQHSDLKYQLADEKGILVWSEIPFVHDYSGREGENAKQQLTELILQNYNHPCIYTWGLWNEVRAYVSKSEPCVLLTEELNTLAQLLDKTRKTASASDRDIMGNMENLTDLQAWNKYFGWYNGQYEDLGKWLDESHTKYPNIPLAISEYGAGGNISQQNITLLDKPFGDHFPEMDQTFCHEISWKIIKDRPYIWSSFVWNMFDFSIAGWNRGGITNLNHKGLITYDRETKKDAFYFYKTNWSKDPVLYIAERRNSDRKESLTTVKVYSNQPAVTLWLNGEKLTTQNLVSDIKIFEFKNIKLKPGDNLIKVTTEKLADEVSWKLL